MISESLYSIALYRHIMNDDVSDTIFLIGDNISYTEVLNSLENVIVFDKKQVGFLGISDALFFLLGIKRKRFDELWGLLSTIDSIYGHDHLVVSRLFKDHKITLVEDGLSNYFEPKKQGVCKEFLKKVIFKRAHSKGYNSKHDEIYLTGLLPLPKSFKAKVNWIDKQLFLKSLTTLGNGVFSPDLQSQKLYSLIITQPLSEEGAITELEKVNLYKGVISKYRLKNVIIKPHPRETTMYQEYFDESENVNVLKPHILSESLFLALKFSVICTVSSASVYSSDVGSARLIVLGTGIHPALKGKLGEIPFFDSYDSNY